jgi:hypothetical protein
MSRAAFAWAVSRALRYAIGIGVVALLLAMTMSGVAAERFATVAYLAAIAAAIAIVAGRFLPAPDDAARSQAPFPLFLGFCVGVIAILSALAALVSEPAAEAGALLACIGLVVFAVLVRCGTVAAFGWATLRGGPLAAMVRYAVLACLTAFVVAAISSGTGEDRDAILAFRLMVVVGVLLAVVMFGRTEPGTRLSAALGAFVARLARELAFAKSVRNIAAIAVLSMLVAGVLPQPYSEPFAAIAYAAFVAASFGLIVECRRLRA